MKSLIPHVLILCTVLAALAAAWPSQSIVIQQQQQQQHLGQIEIAADPEGTVMVPGHNNVTYGPIPKEDQLLQIEFLEIAPSPIPVDQIFFFFLRGAIPQSREKDLERLPSLTTATLSITLSAVLPDGKRENPQTYTVPLRTTAFTDTAHIAIRDGAGAYVDHLRSSGRNDILADYWIPGLFLRTGTWTFEVVARLGDGACLFALSSTQWLEGRLK